MAKETVKTKKTTTKSTSTGKTVRKVAEKGIAKNKSGVKQTSAKVKFVHMAPQKIRRVANLVRGLYVLDAENILKNIPKRAAVPISKAINSAKANAVHNESMDEKKLVIKEIFVNESMTLRRMRPRAHGRGFPIKKKFSHIDLVLTELERDTTDKSGKAGHNKVKTTSTKMSTSEKKSSPVIKNTKIK